MQFNQRLYDYPGADLNHFSIYTCSVLLNRLYRLIYLISSVEYYTCTAFLPSDTIEQNQMYYT